jgi:CBS domain-containing protein
VKGHARNFMTERVTSVAPDIPIDAVARTLVTGRFSGLPVTDRRGQLLGFVSESDVVAALVRDPNAAQAAARTIMTSPAVVVDEFDTSDEVIRLMREKNVDQVLVVRQGRLVGIITPHDVLRFFVEHVLPVPPEAS